MITQDPGYHRLKQMFIFLKKFPTLRHALEPKLDSRVSICKFPS